jgi:hypothetical protein
MNSKGQLRSLIDAITGGDAAAVRRQLAASPGLVRACFEEGATRQEAEEFFLREIDRYIVAGDTALHIAAAAHNAEIVRILVESGADVHAANRFGDQPLHAAARANPSSERWKPAAQTATIAELVGAGADPNTVNKRGVAPLHVAVRARSAAAVRALLELGADPARKNKSGSTPLVLAKYTTGRSGSGSPESREQQKEIQRLLDERLTPAAT